MSAGIDAGSSMRRPVTSLTQAAHGQDSRRRLFGNAVQCPSAQVMWISRLSTRRISTGVRAREVMLLDPLNAKPVADESSFIAEPSRAVAEDRAALGPGVRRHPRRMP